MIVSFGIFLTCLLKFIILVLMFILTGYRPSSALQIMLFVDLLTSRMCLRKFRCVRSVIVLSHLS